MRKKKKKMMIKSLFIQLRHRSSFSTEAIVRLFNRLFNFKLKLQAFRRQHRCFPVKFCKFLRAPFITEHLMRKS